MTVTQSTDTEFSKLNRCGSNTPYSVIATAFMAHKTALISSQKVRLQHEIHVKLKVLFDRLILFV